MSLPTYRGEENQEEKINLMSEDKNHLIIEAQQNKILILIIKKCNENKQGESGGLRAREREREKY